MKFQIANIEILRLDAAIPSQGSGSIDVKEDLNIMIEYDTDKKLFGIRWQIHCVDKKTKTEVIGILAQHRTIYSLENEQKDIQSIEKFLIASFFNLCEKFREKFPRLKSYQFTPIDYEKTAKEYYKLLSS